MFDASEVEIRRALTGATDHLLSQFDIEHIRHMHTQLKEANEQGSGTLPADIELDFATYY